MDNHKHVAKTIEALPSPHMPWTIAVGVHYIKLMVCCGALAWEFPKAVFQDGSWLLVVVAAIAIMESLESMANYKVGYKTFVVACMYYDALQSKMELALSELFSKPVQDEAPTETPNEI